MVASSAMGCPLHSSVLRRFSRSADTRVDFLAENLLGALDSQRGHLLAQGLRGRHRSLLGLSLGRRATILLASSAARALALR